MQKAANRFEGIGLAELTGHVARLMRQPQGDTMRFEVMELSGRLLEVADERRRHDWLLAETIAGWIGRLQAHVGL